MTNHTHRFGLVPIEQHTNPDPYPERQTRDHGVRQHNQPTPAPARKVEIIPVNSGPLHVAANPSNLDGASARRWLTPWASTGLYAIGQVALAAAIAVGHVGPLTGIAVCLIWLLCGGLLIAAQLISQAEPIDADRRPSDA